MAASEARQLGYGRVSEVSRACGLSRVTITKALAELDAAALETRRIRRGIGGRRTLVDFDPVLPTALDSQVDPLFRGDPESPLRWTSKSTRALAAELAGQDHQVSHDKVAQIFCSLDYGSTAESVGEFLDCIR
jgi:hypothetical protein